MLSAIKYEDVRIELCKEILSNPDAFNNSTIGEPVKPDPRPPRADDKEPGKDPSKKEKIDPIDHKKEKQNEIDRKNNFRLKIEKKFTNDCPMKSKKNDTKPKDNNPINDDPQNPDEIIKPKKDDILPKDTRTPLPYKDDAIEDWWKKIRPIIQTLKNLKSKFLIKDLLI